MWKSTLKVQILDIFEQFIHCLVEEPGLQLRLYYTVVYARNEVQKKEMLWQNLMQLTLQNQLPWIISGDFNSVLSSDDRMGSPVTQQEVQGFQNVIDYLQLTPIKGVGWHFTWCNKQGGNKRVYSKID